MKRRSSEFYREVYGVRERFGENEYDVEDLVKAIVPILKKHRKEEDELEKEAIRGIIHRIEQSEDVSQQGNLFSHEAHVPLGERRRIKRGRMTLDQALCRRRVIDENHIAQNLAWGKENTWLNDTIEILRKFPPETVRNDVLNEDGTIKVAPAAD